MAILKVSLSKIFDIECHLSTHIMEKHDRSFRFVISNLELSKGIEAIFSSIQNWIVKVTLDVDGFLPTTFWYSIK